MQKQIALFLLIAIVCCFVGCAFPTGPDFKDFAAYKEDFILVRDFLLAQDIFQDNPDKVFVLLNADIVNLATTKVGNEAALLSAVDRLCARGFDYVWAYADHMIFWTDETKKYGVLWAKTPIRVLEYMKEIPRDFKRIDREWYEVGVLDSI